MSAKRQQAVFNLVFSIVKVLLRKQKNQRKASWIFATEFQIINLNLLLVIYFYIFIYLFIFFLVHFTSNNKHLQQPIKAESLTANFILKDWRLKVCHTFVSNNSQEDEWKGVPRNFNCHISWTTKHMRPKKQSPAPNFVLRNKTEQTIYASRVGERKRERVRGEELK